MKSRPYRCLVLESSIEKHSNGVRRLKVPEPDGIAIALAKPSNAA